MKTLKNLFIKFLSLFKSSSKQVDTPNIITDSKEQEPVKAPASPSPTSSSEKLLGIDVSHHNGPLDWKAIKKAGVKYAYIKCTEGTGFTDPRFLLNVRGAKEVGIPVGAYHFFRPGKDPIAQAKFFLGKIKELNLELIPDCDWEVHDGMSEAAQVAQIKVFLDCVEHSTGVKPMIYTGKWFIDQVEAKDKKTPLPQWFANYPLWLSDYSPSSVAVPKPWTRYTLLQVTESGTLPGVSGRFDINWINSLDELKASGVHR